MEKEQSKKITFSIERELKEKAENKFKASCGISFSNGLAVLLTAFINEKIQIFK